MTTWDFCFWLRGFLDGAGDELGSVEVALIKQRLEETIEKDSKAPDPPSPWPHLMGPTFGHPNFKY